MRLSTALRIAIAVLRIVPECSAEAWPYTLPRDAKYYPMDEHHVKREVQIQERLASENPVHVKKMSEDEGEKFFLQYWGFDDERSNSSIEFLEPAIARHTNHDRFNFHLFGRSIFSRDYKCPDKTNACSDVDSPLCCPEGQTCVKINDGVGCCPSDSNCGGSIGRCDTGAGYKSCPDSKEGGCCIPGAECKDFGCVFYGTLTTTTTAAPSTSAPPPSNPGSTSTVTVTTTVGGQPTTILSTTTVVIASQTKCSSGFQTCESSLGGGCCPTDRVCGTSNSCLTSTSSAASAPIRPTSVTDSTVTGAAVPTTTTATSNELCPTGFYMCEARYLGGCCRVGRDCQTTSCPSTASTQVVSSGATVLVPASASQGSCPKGWDACASSAGGGCCPSNYLCGMESCTATISGQQNTGKMAPSSAVSTAVIWGFFMLAFTTAVGMLVL